MESAKRVINYMRQRFGLLAPYVALTAPASPVLGDLWSNTTAGLLKRWDGAAWTAVGGGAPGAHATSHQDGGSDEISVTGLAGLLTTAQTPILHAASHQNGGSDEVATATAAANVIPKAGAGGRLAVGFMPTTLGAMKQIYANVVAGAAITSWSLTTQFNGDADFLYFYRFRLVEAQLNTVLSVIFNNDTGASYGYSAIANSATTVSGTQSSNQANFPLAFVNAAGHTAAGHGFIHPVTGFVRTISLFVQEQVTASVLTTVAYRMGLWENTADNITRMDFVSSVASGIGIGSSLEIWAMRPTYAEA